MQTELEEAIVLRKEEKYKASNTFLLKLVQEYPSNAFINYQCAWSFDLLGEEAEAVPFYEKAIELGLAGENLENALLGLGSTYRVLGDYEKSQKIFLNGITLFPNNRALQVFYSMTLYNLKEHGDAIEILLKCLIETTTDKEILNYERAINFYSDKLEKVWR